MSRLIFAPSAEHDLAEIVDYIARDKPTAARRFVSQLRETCRILGNGPELGQLRPDIGDGAYRTFSHGAYVIFYQYLAESDEVQIHRVVHGARDLGNLFG